MISCIVRARFDLTGTSIADMLQCKEFSQLHQLFELCSPASSAPVERVFSQMASLWGHIWLKCQTNYWKRLSFWNTTQRLTVVFPVKLTVVTVDWDDHYNCVYTTWFYAIIFKYTTLILSLKCEALTLALECEALALNYEALALTTSGLGLVLLGRGLDTVGLVNITVIVAWAALSSSFKGASFLWQ